MLPSAAMSEQPRQSCHVLCRRNVLTAGLGGLCLLALSPLDGWSQDAASSALPQRGDVLVKAGDASKKPLTPADIPSGEAFVSAWPMDATTKTVRSGSRLNSLVLLKVDPNSLSPESRADAAAGVVAYSALCTHAGCDVSTWIPGEGLLSCDCHGSEFDVKSSGKVTVGPATRALPPLALELTGDLLTVARPFQTVIRFDEA